MMKCQLEGDLLPSFTSICFVMTRTSGFNKYTINQECALQPGAFQVVLWGSQGMGSDEDACGDLTLPPRALRPCCKRCSPILKGKVLLALMNLLEPHSSITALCEEVLQGGRHRLESKNSVGSFCEQSSGVQNPAMDTCTQCMITHP
ncbi:hypothetical protein DV515_00006927 [Chloebia gouldiae]|uniref:Uncharacterized protein n=1 Tax=Chloebia gouldiae TaxID=44316 RepID=A0A3L8SJZ3_CHLGU|nr:hypothetical protein DV515_00006927 [Chloebia gouldiae]